MIKLNLIVIFNKSLDKVLFCIRAKEPYKGLYNFVGGKVEKRPLVFAKKICKILIICYIKQVPIVKPGAL